MTDPVRAKLSERMRDGLGAYSAAYKFAPEVSALEQRLAAVLEGQDSLKAQTVRIRAALGGSTRDTPNGLTGDTEDIARDCYKRLAAAEGLVPEGWRIKQTLSNPWGTEHYAELSQITTNSSRSGTGPTVEAAVRNAAEKVTK